MQLRLKMVPWFLAWAVLTSLQLYFALKMLPGAEAGADVATSAFSASVMVLFAFQVLKIPLAMPRLNDLGRPTDDAFLGLVPLVNIGLWGQLFARTPSEEKRDRLRQQWIHETSALQAARHGAVTLGRSLLTLVPLLVVSTAVLALGDHLGSWFLDVFLPHTPAETLDGVIFGLKAGVAGLGLYTGLQLLKLRTASRASWLPSLLILSMLMLWGTIAMRDMAEMKAALVSLPFQAIDLVVSIFFGGLVSIAFMTLADRASQGKSLGFESWQEILENVRTRGLDVIAVHGGATLAIAIGMQIVIPGVHYMLVYAFASFQALKFAEERSFRQSSILSSGIRRRLFLTMLIPSLAYALVSVGMVVVATPVGVAFDGALSSLGLAGLEFKVPYNAEVWFVSTFLDPRVSPRWVDLTLAPFELMRSAAVTFALWPIWLDRRQRLVEKPTVAVEKTTV